MKIFIVNQKIYDADDTVDSRGFEFAQNCEPISLDSKMPRLKANQYLMRYQFLTNKISKFKI